MPRTESSPERVARESGLGGFVRRSALGVWDTFVRDNRVIPPVLAIVALVIFSWVVAGTFIGNGAQDQPVSNRQEIAQSPEEANPAPEIDNPDSDNYAAYQSKDPFRQIFEPASSGESTDGSGDSGSGDSGDGSGDGGSGNGGNNNDNQPRTDQTTDPDDSAAGNQYDQDETTGRNQNQGNNQNQNNNGNNGSSSDDDLFDSGGDLLPPP